jgi:thioredoxin reductase (NADPH)
MTQTYKVAIIGGGAAGLSAAIALGCEGIDATIFAPSFGGRMGISPAIENIPGFVGGIPGDDWNAKLQQQAHEFGAHFMTAEAIALWHRAVSGRYDVVSGGADGNVFTYGAYDAVVLATGITMSAPTAPTVVNMRQVQVVAGGGDAAVQVALQHAKSGVTTILAVRGDNLHKCSLYLRSRINSAEGLTVHYNTEASCSVTVPGYVRLENAEGTRYVPHASLQTLIGGEPRAAKLFGVELDERGFILTDQQFHTSRPRVFAVGDARSGSIKRVAVAAGEGIAVGHIIASVLRGA